MRGLSSKGTIGIAIIDDSNATNEITASTTLDLTLNLTRMQRINTAAAAEQLRVAGEEKAAGSEADVRKEAGSRSRAGPEPSFLSPPSSARSGGSSMKPSKQPSFEPLWEETNLDSVKMYMQDLTKKPDGDVSAGDSSVGVKCKLSSDCGKVVNFGQNSM